MEVKIDYKLIAFLYAYLRQIDLSLDRARWGLWNDLREYFKAQIQPKYVAVEILEMSDINPPVAPVVYFVKEPNYIDYVKAFWSRVIIKKSYMIDVEILYCYQLLNRFDFQLNTEFVEYPLEAEKLRIEIATFYSYVLKPKLSPKVLSKAERIEHYMQNERLSVVPIKEFKSQD